MVHRRTWQFLLASALIAGAALVFWLVVAHPQDVPIPETAPQMAQQIRINSLRITILERRVEEMEQAHDRILWLLIGNLAAAMGALATYTLTHRRRRGLAD